MRHRSALERLADLFVHVHRTGQVAGQDFLDRVAGRREDLGHLDEFLQREIHRLELRLARAHHRAERHETQVLVEAQLPGRSRDDRHVETLLPVVLRQQPNQFGEDEPVAVLLLDGQQAHFNDFVALWQMRFEVGEFLVQ